MNEIVKSSWQEEPFQGCSLAPQGPPLQLRARRLHERVEPPREKWQLSRLAQARGAHRPPLTHRCLNAQPNTYRHHTTSQEHGTKCTAPLLVSLYPCVSLSASSPPSVHPQPPHTRPRLHTPATPHRDLQGPARLPFSLLHPPPSCPSHTAVRPPPSLSGLRRPQSSAPAARPSRRPGPP